MPANGGKANIVGICPPDPKRMSGRPFHGIRSPANSACHFVVIIVIGHEATATAPRALLLIVRTLFNDAFAIAVWTGFHVPLRCSSSHYASRRLAMAAGLISDIEYEIEAGVEVFAGIRDPHQQFALK